MRRRFQGWQEHMAPTLFTFLIQPRLSEERSAVRWWLHFTISILTTYQRILVSHNTLRIGRFFGNVFPPSMELHASPIQRDRAWKNFSPASLGEFQRQLQGITSRFQARPRHSPLHSKESGPEVLFLRWPSIARTKISIFSFGDTQTWRIA